MTLQHNFSFRYLIPAVFYFFMLFGVSALSYKKPAYNWDMLAYSAVVLQYDHQAKDIHQQVYQLAAQQLPSDTYNLLAGTSGPRKRWTEDGEAFRQTLPFYVVKPLYTAIAYVFFKLGLPIFKATVIPSIIAYLMTGTLLFIWLCRYIKLVPATIISFIIMLLPPIAAAAKLSSPDFLAGMLMFYAIYFLTAAESINGFFILSLLSVVSRIDFMLPLVVLLIALTFFTKTLTIRKFIFFMGIAAITYLIISSNTQIFGWNILFFPSFIKTLNPHHDAGAVFTFKDYWEVLKAQVFTALYYSHFAWLLLVSLLTLLQHHTDEFKSRKHIIIVISLLMTLMVRFLLQPVIADRFYIGYYMIILCLFITRLPLKKQLSV